MTESPELPGKEQCPGVLTWSAFGASYPDTVCSSALDWTDCDYEPIAILCDADDDHRPKDIPCPFCNPDGFIEYQWGTPDEIHIRWATDDTTVTPGTEIHFHDSDDAALWWTATHPDRGEERVLIRTLDIDEDSPTILPAQVASGLLTAALAAEEGP